MDEHLVRLDYSGLDCRLIETGTTDPNLLFLVRGRGGDPDFIINRGLPGAGGVATQAAELGALGVRRMVHVGTCGLVADEVRAGSVIVARASYKDGGAIMLSDTGEGGEIDPLAHSDAALTRVLREGLAGGADECSDAVGYTIPVFYFQPLKLIHDLITGEVYPDGPKVGYFEMGQASFFETCRLLNVQGGRLRPLPVSGRSGEAQLRGGRRPGRGEAVDDQDGPAGFHTVAARAPGAYPPVSGYAPG